MNETTAAFKEGQEAAKGELAMGADVETITAHVEAGAKDGDDFFAQFDQGYLYELKRWLAANQNDIEA